MKGKLKLSYVLTLCLSFTLAVAMPLIASTAMCEEWVARYNSLIGDDFAKAIAVDSAGNVYVTGRSGSEPDCDYATVKYDTDGNQLWVQRYNGPGNGIDEPHAVAVDAAGNVYVTGTSDGGGTGDDYATVKYDTDGSQLWVKRYNGPGNGIDEPSAIAVDAAGNVYVTGSCYAGATRWYDYATVKYDTNGNQLWVTRYNSGYHSDVARAIAVDTSGNVYVTGSSLVGSPPAVRPDYATVKYDTAGNELWVARYTGPTEYSSAAARAIAIDASGNVYVTGTSKDGYATVKYDTDGNQLWVRRYNGPGNGIDEPHAVAVDAAGNVYVTGTSDGGGTGDDYATMKYDTNGNRLWVKRYNGPGNGNDGSEAMVVDTSGNVYVTGKSFGSGTRYDYTTVKYDTDGNELWVKPYNAPENGNEGARAITVDASGNVYVTGESKDGYATVKYDTDGNRLWIAQYNGPRGNGNDRATAMAIDAFGNVYVTGRSEGSGTEGDYATVKYDTDGNRLWVAQYNGPIGNDEASAMAIDGSGNVYVTGYSKVSETDYDYATVKYDTDGNELWVARYNSPADGSDGASAIAIDASGNVYVTGRGEGSGRDYNYTTVKYDTDGNELWVARYNGPGDYNDYATAMAMDGSGNIYVTGGSHGNGTWDDYATVKYDTHGNQLWVARYNGPGNDDDQASAIALDPSGNVYITGESGGSGTRGDYATIKYDSDGNEIWVKRYNGPGNSWDRSEAIALDPSGNVYVTGDSQLISMDYDYATVKYDTDGNQLWVKRYNGPGNSNDSVSAMAVDASGNVYVTGNSWSGTDFDYATVKYDTNGNQLWVKRYNGPGNDTDRASAIALDLSGNVYVTGISCGSGTGHDYATVKYSEGLPAGWSMISLPVRPAVATVKTLFPEAVVVYKYQKGTGYVRVTGEESLEDGVGYWILLDKPRPYLKDGTDITEYTIPVADGWYMIGGCSMPADKMVTSGKIDVIYGYTQGKGYTRVPASQPLGRGKGYWILFSDTSEEAEFTASTSASE